MDFFFGIYLLLLWHLRWCEVEQKCFRSELRGVLVAVAGDEGLAQLGEEKKKTKKVRRETTCEFSVPENVVPANQGTRGVGQCQNPSKFKATASVRK
jgi:hypothetical protein